MKHYFCLFLIVLGIHALTDEQKQKMETYSKQCRSQTGITQELIDKGRSGEFVNDSRLKNQILCIMKKVGMITEEGIPVEEDIRRKLKKVANNNEEVEKIITKCVVKTKSPEETAFNLAKCLNENKSAFSPVD